MATKTPSPETIWRTPDALWKLIAPILGPDQTTRHGRTPGHTQPRPVRRHDLCVAQRLSMAGHSASNLRPWIDRAWPVPTMGTTRRVRSSLADVVALL